MLGKRRIFGIRAQAWLPILRYSSLFFVIPFVIQCSGDQDLRSALPDPPGARTSQRISLPSLRREGVRVSFGEYCKAGVPLTLLTLALGVAWLRFVPY